MTAMNDFTGRPERDETTEYYFRYIDLVPDGDIRATLAAQRDETLAFLALIPESRASHRYEPGKWSVTEALCHMNDCERLFSMRAFWFARGFDSPLPSFEQEFAMERAAPGNHPWSEHVQEFGALRASTVFLFQHLPPDAWLRRGTASGYPFSVRALAWLAAGHVIHHTRILKERYLEGL